MKWARKIRNRRLAKLSKSAVIDSGATSSFWREEDPHVKTGVASNKVVMMPTGNTATASEKGLMTMNGLKEEAREIDVLPDLKHNSLISVSKLSDAGYTTVFQPKDGGVAVYWTDDIVIHVKKEAVLQGWRDATGL